MTAKSKTISETIEGIQLLSSVNLRSSVFGLPTLPYICSFKFFVTMSRKGKVLVAMSGGIDSTVVALMLNDQGYEVVGITMKTWDYSGSGGGRKKPAAAM